MGELQRNSIIFIRNSKKMTQKNQPMQKKSTANIYEQFIHFLKTEENFLKLNQLKNLEKHHIIPLHNGGLKKGSVVLCTPKKHTLAHYYRYLT